MDNKISAKIICDSKDGRGNRATTFILTYPRIIHSEFMTHGMLVKNAASSRAIPFEKMVKMIEEEPFIPQRWMKDHKGMQGNEYLSEDTIFGYEYTSIVGLPTKPISHVTASRETWIAARNNAIAAARQLSEIGVTKQICNRLLEPFMYITVICTGTEWENFFALRAHPDAEIHLQELAYKMLDAYNESEPKTLQPGEWHLPFGDQIDDKKLIDFCTNNYDDAAIDDLALERRMDEVMIKISAARCARLSYMTFEGKIDYSKDLELHDRLLMGNPKHASPSAHQLRCMSDEEYRSHMKGKFKIGYVGECEMQIFTEEQTPEESPNLGWCKQFRGFIPYRSMIEGENAKDNRVIKK